MARGLTPTSKTPINTTKKENTLDCNFQVLKKLGFKKNIIVIGKNKSKIIKKYSAKFDIVENDRWINTNNLYSFSLTTSKISGLVLISYGDIVFNEKAINKLLFNNKNDFVIAYDSSWKRRYIHRSKKSLEKVELIKSKNNLLEKLFKGNNIHLKPDGEFCGLLLISPNGSKIISELMKNTFLLPKSLKLDRVGLVDNRHSTD